MNARPLLDVPNANGAVTGSGGDELAQRVDIDAQNGRFMACVQSRAVEKA